MTRLRPNQLCKEAESPQGLSQAILGEGALGATWPLPASRFISRQAPEGRGENAGGGGTPAALQRGRSSGVWYPQPQRCCCCCSRDTGLAVALRFLLLCCCYCCCCCCCSGCCYCCCWVHTASPSGCGFLRPASNGGTQPSPSLPYQLPARFSSPLSWKTHPTFFQYPAPYPTYFEGIPFLFA